MRAETREHSVINIELHVRDRFTVIIFLQSFFLCALHHDFWPPLIIILSLHDAAWVSIVFII